jgi:(p)ppGpp synthase/HD superfamily hydrolase
MKILKAIQFAAEKHKGQERRGSGLPYATHPIIIMELVQKYKCSSKHLESLKCAALLHDTLEDCDCTFFELEREFGSLTASIVMELTSDEEEIERIGEHNYLTQKMMTMSQYSFTLKLLDRLSNILDKPDKKYKVKTVETMEYFMEFRQDVIKRQEMIMSHIIGVIDGMPLHVIDSDVAKFKEEK